MSRVSFDPRTGRASMAVPITNTEYLRQLAMQSAPRPTARMRRLAERVISTRAAARKYRGGTGLHPEPTATLRHLLRLSHEAKAAFVRAAVRWGASDADARARVDELLAADDEEQKQAVDRAARWLARLETDEG